MLLLHVLNLVYVIASLVLANRSVGAQKTRCAGCNLAGGCWQLILLLVPGLLARQYSYFPVNVLQIPADYLREKLLILGDRILKAYILCRPSLTPSFYISVSPNSIAKRSQPQYVATEGTVTTNISQASVFQILQTGQLRSAGQLVSTSGLAQSEPFETQPTTGAVSTLFSILDDQLVWMSDAFVGQRALFCVFGPIVSAVFNGVLPESCLQVTLNIVYTSQVVLPTTTGFSSTQSSPLSLQGTGTATSVSLSPSAPGSVHSGSASADPVSCVNSPTGQLALSGPNTTVSTLEQCLSFCTAYTYFGVQYGTHFNVQ